MRCEISGDVRMSGYDSFVCLVVQARCCLFVCCLVFLLQEWWISWFWKRWPHCMFPIWIYISHVWLLCGTLPWPLQAMGPDWPHPPLVLRRLMHEIDVDGSGTVNYTELSPQLGGSAGLRVWYLTRWRHVTVFFSQMCRKEIAVFRQGSLQPISRRSSICRNRSVCFSVFSGATAMAERNRRGTAAGKRSMNCVSPEQKNSLCWAHGCMAEFMLSTT